LASIEASIQDAGYQFLGVSDGNELAHSEENKKPKVDSNNAEAKQVKSELPESSSNYQFSISGMTCASCVNTVQMALASSEGVVSADVNFANHYCSGCY